MIRLRLSELHAEKAFREGRRIEWQEVAATAGIHRVTLSKMRNQRGYNATLSNIDLLCRYFECTVSDLLVYVPDEELATPRNSTFKGPEPDSPRRAKAKPGAGSLTAPKLPATKAKKESSNARR